MSLLKGAQNRNSTPCSAFPVHWIILISFDPLMMLFQRQWNMQFALFAKRENSVGYLASSATPRLFPVSWSSALILVVQPIFKPFINHPTSSSYPDTAMGNGIIIVKYLIREDNHVSQALFVFAKAVFIFPGYFLAFHVVGNVRSIHFTYWWQKPSGYYWVALKQSGWNVMTTRSSLWLSSILVVVNDFTMRYTSGSLFLPMLTRLKVVTIKLIWALRSSSVFL